MELARAGVRQTVMLTGDNARTAAAIAAQAGVSEYRADLLPADKITAIKELRQEYGNVAMVGDGVNDAPALAAVIAVFPGWLILWLAILADMGATILVTLNGIRLLRISSGRST